MKSLKKMKLNNSMTLIHFIKKLEAVEADLHNWKRNSLLNINNKLSTNAVSHQAKKAIFSLMIMNTTKWWIKNKILRNKEIKDFPSIMAWLHSKLLWLEGNHLQWNNHHLKWISFMPMSHPQQNTLTYLNQLGGKDLILR